MKLHEGQIGKEYIVRSVQVDDAITRRLESLGVNEMTPLQILNKKGSGSVIIKIRGTRLALGNRISDGIMIEETELKSPVTAKERSISSLPATASLYSTDTGGTGDGRK